MANVPKNTKRKPTAKKEFSLSDFKKKNGYDKTVKFKPRRYLPITNVLGNNAFQEATGLNRGIPANESLNILGHTDSGKSSLLLEAAYSAQKEGILPVFVITELKFSWEHLRTMGIKFEEEIDENTGEITYVGDFLFIDRSKFNTIEEMGDRLNEILDAQEDGSLPRDLCFLIDSIGTLPSKMSYEKSTSNNEWDAGAISRVFGKSLIPRINLCKKDGFPYDNWFFVVTQVWTLKPDSPMGKPKIMPKGGTTIPFNSAIQIQFGNNAHAGTNKLKVQKNGKEVSYATRTRVDVIKNHINGLSTKSKIVTTVSGFLPESPNDKIAKDYFKNNAEIFMDVLGGGDVKDVEFFEEESNSGPNYGNTNVDVDSFNEEMKANKDFDNQKE